MSVNKTIILGRLGDDPEVKQTSSGTSVCNFSVATSLKWNNKSTGQAEEKTEWHRVVVWGKMAELCGQYLSKGRQAFIEGRNETRSWEDKNGVKRYTTEVVASSVQFIGGNADSNNALKDAHDKAEGDYDIATDSNFAADDIPF